MKQFIWMLCGIFLSGLLLGTLSACGADQFSTAVITTAKSSAPEKEKEVPVEVQDGGTARRLAYGKALWDMALQGVLPEGDRLDWTSPEAAAENRFALADVDGDGEEELVVCWTNACVAGMRGLVYGYHDGRLRTELFEFPDLTFYGTGAVTAGWSHSQGWAGRFWPINVYQYAPETDDYTLVGAVDAWDFEDTKGDPNLSAFFPREVDADGDGLVYYILTGEWYKQERTAPDGSLYQLWSTDPVDGPALEEWLASYTGVAEALDIPFQALNEANIAALGCPKPDVTYPEPAG